MKIDTSRFGPLEIDDDSIIRFSAGILGFPDEKSYVLLPHREGSPFLWLQSVDNPELAFLVINPFVINREYSFEIPDAVQDEMGIEGAETVQTLVLVTVRRNEGEGKSQVTANMLGPVIINTKNMKARQLALDPRKYDVRYSLSVPGQDS